MSSDYVESRVREIVAEQLGLGVDEVQPDASFSEDLGADDLDFLEILMSFEEEFDIEIDDEDAVGLKTVRDAVEFIARRS